MLKLWRVSRINRDGSLQERFAPLQIVAASFEEAVRLYREVTGNTFSAVLVEDITEEERGRRRLETGGPAVRLHSAEAY